MNPTTTNSSLNVADMLLAKEIGAGEDVLNPEPGVAGRDDTDIPSTYTRAAWHAKWMQQTLDRERGQFCLSDAHSFASMASAPAPSAQDVAKTIVEILNLDAVHRLAAKLNIDLPTIP